MASVFWLLNIGQGNVYCLSPGGIKPHWITWNKQCWILSMGLERQVRCNLNQNTHIFCGEIYLKMTSGHGSLLVAWIRFRNRGVVNLMRHKQSCYGWNKVPSLIARFMGPTWGPSGADRAQVGPMLGPWTLPSGYCLRSRASVIGIFWHLDTRANISFLSFVNCVFIHGTIIFLFCLPELYFMHWIGRMPGNLKIWSV